MANGPKTQDEINALLAGQAQVVPVHAPGFYATNVQLMSVGNDAILVLQKNDPIMIAESPSNMVPAAQLNPVAYVHLSFKTLKDLSLIFADTVAAIEREWGPIETDFTRRRDADAVK